MTFEYPPHICRGLGRNRVPWTETSQPWKRGHRQTHRCGRAGVIYAALLDPFPYRDVDRIVRLTVQTKAGFGEWFSLNGPQVRQFARAAVDRECPRMEYHVMT